ncbi:hypothetical protein JMJ35_003872 [Cladonia borealis]|uniref:Uncharacterized protein n=1 Tax=Cladonia borealis TaxID=184061 RepID=A0AA39R3H9_9LECA|nr:hypothetical protein JMJ35_003872 [Cladonia borealis]
MSTPLHLKYFTILQPLLLTAAATPKDIWRVSIWEAPAPPPGKGAPLQASALRNPSYLPAQIASIIGAYVFSVIVIGTAILLVGRRLRRAAQASPGSLAMEMMKPVKQDVSKAFDPSPISPSKSNPYGPSPESTVDMRNNWPSPNPNKSPNKSARSSGGWGSLAKGHKKQSSVQSSVVTFDESVIEDDKERNQKEMERLYAAVMEHDEKKSTSLLNVSEKQQPQNPPELQHLRSSQHPASVPLPRLDTTRSLTKSPRTSSRPTPLSLHSRNSSRSSFGSFGKKRGVRNLPISPPMGSPDLIPDYNDVYGEAEPLSPRVYDDPGPPPPTPPQKKANRSRDQLDRLSPRSARFQEPSDQLDRLSPRSARFPEPSIRTPRTSVPPTPTIQTIPEAYSRSELQSRDSDRSGSSNDGPKPRRAPAPLSLRTQALNGSNSQRNPQQHHPLRSAPLPLRNQHPTDYNSNRPPSTIKATVLERKAPNQSLRTPQTGVPMTPYSPYMPFTPLTPMTPSRLVTREERKRREKEEGRRVVTVEDAVEEESDIWGEAYS